MFRILYWGWKEQIDDERLDDALQELKEFGPLRAKFIDDGSNDYELVLYSDKLNFTEEEWKMLPMAMRDESFPNVDKCSAKDLKAFLKLIKVQWDAEAQQKEEAYEAEREKEERKKYEELKKKFGDA